MRCVRMIVVLLACISVNVCAADAEWVSIFNGRDLDGWVTNGKNWRVIEEDGEPVIESFAGGPSITYEKPFGDAILDVWFKLPPGHNSGVFFRGSSINPNGYPPPPTSYEMQLYDLKHLWGHRTGDLLYPHRARTWASKPGQWNHCTIISVGYRHKAYLNGQCIFDAIDADAPLRGYVCLQSHGDSVYFKRVRVKEIEGGKWPERTGRLKAMLFVGGQRGIGQRVDVHGAHIEGFMDATGRFEITWSPLELALEPQYLDYCDLLILYDNRSDLSEKARGRIADFVRKGGGLLVLNRSACGTFTDWPEFAKISAAAQGKPEWVAGDVRVAAVDQSHPIAVGVCPFNIRDDHPRRAGLTPDAAPVFTDGDTPVGWTGRYGKGKVFCLVLGQEESTLLNPNFQRIVVNAATWCCVPDPSPDVLRLAGKGDSAGLARLLSRPTTRADWPVLDALARIGDVTAAKAFAEVAVGEGELVVRAAAAANLGGLEKGGLEELHDLLARGQPAIIRATAACALGRRGSPRSVVPLTRALEDESEYVRWKAMGALGRIDSPKAEKVLLAKLNGDDAWWYDVALGALGQADSDSARAALVAIARERDAKYRFVLPDVASALAAQIKHPEVFDALVALLDAPEEEARLSAARALAKSGDGRVHAIMFPRVFGGDVHVGRVAEEYVRSAGRVNLNDYIGGFVAQCLVCGPFSNANNRAARESYPPEKEFKSDAAYDCVGGKAVWAKTVAQDNKIDFTKLYPDRKDNVVAYARFVVESDGDRELQMRVGSDDGVVVWINGREVHRLIRPRGLTPDEDRVKVRLVKGDNRVLVKVLQGGGDWGFCLRFADPKADLSGLKFRLP